MKFYDFEYDGLKLSDFGYTVCKFGSQNLETVSNGSQLTFNTISVEGGKKNYLVDTKYEKCLECTFQICKNPCNNNIMNISLQEESDIMSWLNRKQYNKFKILESDYLDLFFESTFNISKIEMNDEVYGFELNMVANAPFAYKESTIIQWNVTESDISQSLNKRVLYDTSDEEGYIYPKIEIEILQDGDLIIHNDYENRDTVILNCIKGESITIDYPTLSSTADNIQNRFNWNFFRIVNTFKNKENDITIFLPCNICIQYNPIVKIGL